MSIVIWLSIFKKAGQTVKAESWKLKAIRKELLVVFWFFAFSDTEDEIGNKSDERNRGDDPPQGFLADSAEIPLGNVHDGPDRYQKKRDAKCQEYP